MKNSIIKITVLTAMMILFVTFNSNAQSTKQTSKETKAKTENNKNTSSSSKSEVKSNSKHKFFIHYINIATGNKLYA